VATTTDTDYITRTPLSPRPNRPKVSPIAGSAARRIRPPAYLVQRKRPFPDL